MRSFMISLLLAISVDFSHGVAQTAVALNLNVPNVTSQESLSMTRLP